MTKFFFSGTFNYFYVSEIFVYKVYFAAFIAVRKKKKNEKKRIHTNFIVWGSF